MKYSTCVQKIAVVVERVILEDADWVPFVLIGVAQV